jgi:hypothetical protein
MIKVFPGPKINTSRKFTSEDVFCITLMHSDVLKNSSLKTSVLFSAYKCFTEDPVAWIKVKQSRYTPWRRLGGEEV